MALTAAEVFRDNVTAGVPSSGIHEPKKSEIRTLLSDYERTLDAALEGAALVFVSKAALDARLDHPANTSAWVVGDAAVANNGIYAKVGASGTGSWLRVADLPYSFIIAEDGGAGTPNAIVATTDVPVSGSALVILNLFETNTGSPVTVSFNGGSPLTIKTASGADPVAGGLTGRLLGTISGSSFVLASDQASAAIQAGAEAAVDDAQAWAEGSLPGGAGTKSSREWSEVSEDWALIAQGAVTYNRVSVRGTINGGVGPYDVGVPIGSPNNIDIKVGGVIFDHNLYTVAGTTFTFLADPGGGQPWEAVVQSEVRQLGAVSDGTVGYDELTPEVRNSLGGASRPTGRLSLISGVALPTSDVVGATTVYYTPYAGDTISLWNGANLSSVIFEELSLELDNNVGHAGYHQQGEIFDLFVVDDGGVLRLGTGPAWSAGAVAGSTTARGSGADSTEIEMKRGVWTNKNDILIRYGSGLSDALAVPANRATLVGTFAPPAHGQATDSLDRRLLSNAYNAAPRPVLRRDPASSDTYSVASWYPVNSQPLNRVEVVHCLSGALDEIDATILVQNSTSTGRNVELSIGETTTAPYLDAMRDRRVVINQQTTLRASYRGAPGLGLRYFHWIYQGAGADTQTWYLSGVAPVGLQGAVLT
jgi:hypothetical protein